MPVRMPWVSKRVVAVRQKPAATSAPQNIMLPQRATLRNPNNPIHLPTGIPIVSVKAVQMEPMKDISCGVDVGHQWQDLIDTQGFLNTSGESFGN